MGCGVQSLSPVWLLATPWTAARQTSLSFISQSFLKLMFVESVMPPNYLILGHPLLLLPLVFPSLRVFSSELALRIRRPEYWSFSLSISPSNEHTGLISFRMDWLDLRLKRGERWVVVMRRTWWSGSCPQTRGTSRSGWAVGSCIMLRIWLRDPHSVPGPWRPVSLVMDMVCQYPHGMTAGGGWPPLACAD